MAEQVGSAVLTLSVDDRQFNTGLKAAQSQATAAGQKIGSTLDGIGAAFRNLAGVAGLIGIGAVTQQIIQTGIAAQKAEIQLQSLASAYGESAQAGQAAARIQQVLGISANEASANFAQLYAALRGTGLGLQQLEVLFVGISNAARLSGAGTAEASAALLQLKQGLASGRLQGDELRSVLEQLPAFAQAIAKELNVNVGALRQLGSDGKITSDIIFNAAKRLATATVPGRTEIEQLGIAFQSLQAQAAKALGPAIVGPLTQLAAGFIALREFLKTNQASLTSFGQTVVSFGRTLLPFAAGILAVRSAFAAWALATKAVAVAQAGLLALQGPKGWVILATAVGASAVAAIGLEKVYKGVGDAVGKAGAEAQKAKDQFAALLSGTKAPVGVGLAVDPAQQAKQQAAVQQQRVESNLALQSVRDRILAAKELGSVEAGILRQTIQQRQEIEAGIQAAKDQVTRIGAQIEGLRIQGIDNGPELEKLVAEQRAAANEVRLELEKGATALRDAGKSLKDDLSAGVLELAKVRNDPQGLNQYLNQQQIQERGQRTLQLLMPQFKDAQASFTKLTGAQAPEFRGSVSGVVDAVQRFISQVNAEDKAGTNVAQIQQAIAQNTADLAKVNNDLVTAVSELNGKDWNVVVNVASPLVPLPTP